MDFELLPLTDAGDRFVTLCQSHEQAFFTRASHHDGEASFLGESIAELVRSGVMAATVPAELGGTGVASMRDFIAGMNRMGRGDGSTAIAANMHLFLVWQTARSWRAAKIAGDNVRENSLATVLKDVAAGHLIMAVLTTENGTGLVNPMTEAVRDGSGWRLNGQKSFATGCTAANVLNVMVRVRDATGDSRRAVAQVRRDNPGVAIHDDWDALGMRGSGSHNVTLKDCFVEEKGVTDSGPWGQITPGFLTGSTVANLGLSAVFLGIAEAARAIALRLITSRGQNDRSGLQHLIAEMEIDLAAARAVLERSATNTDAALEAHPETLPVDLAQFLAKDFQCAKRFVTQKAIDIVDRALTASGGSGYLTRSPLSRLYRDVRAGPFMQPWSPIYAFEFIGKITLGVAI
jgi:alkylation response protein AidB-like acyl-CoA dehydrogenase